MVSFCKSLPQTYFSTIYVLCFWHFTDFTKTCIFTYAFVVIVLLLKPKPEFNSSYLLFKSLRLTTKPISPAASLWALSAASVLASSRPVGRACLLGLPAHKRAPIRLVPSPRCPHSFFHLTSAFYSHCLRCQLPHLFFYSSLSSIFITQSQVLKQSRQI